MLVSRGFILLKREERSGSDGGLVGARNKFCPRVYLSYTSIHEYTQGTGPCEFLKKAS
jgi:hypothetical protein